MTVARLCFSVAAFVGIGLSLLVGGMRTVGAAWLRSDEIAYVSYHDFNADIFVVDLIHGLSYNLTNDQAYDVAPSWSPDGEWIAFASDRDGGRNIYVMDRFGRSTRRITDVPGAYTQPRWSADGSSLVFIGIGQQNIPVYAVDIDGSNFRRLDDPENPRATIAIDLAYDPGDINRSLSPDGSQIAFMTYRNSGWGIYISPDVNRRDARLLINIGNFTEAPVWSPNGKQMAYIAQRDGLFDLFVIDVDGDSAPRRLTYNRELDVSPAWRP